MTVQPLDDATNPGGLVDDLAVTLEGPNADRAEVTRDGGIEVKPGRERYAVAYRLTNELDELSAMAFVIVPAVRNRGGHRAGRAARSPHRTSRTWLASSCR